MNMKMTSTKVRKLRIYDGRWFEITETNEDLLKEIRKQNFRYYNSKSTIKNS